MPRSTPEPGPSPASRAESKSRGAQQVSGSGRGESRRDASGRGSASPRGATTTRRTATGASRSAKPSSATPRTGSTKASLTGTSSTGPSRIRAARGNSGPGRPEPRTRALGATSKRPATSQVWRLSALSLVLVLLGVFLFPTVSGYIDQRREVTQLEQQIEAQQGDVADLEGDVKRWSNPDFIERTARDRLRFVRPGETAFTVLDDTGEVLVEPLPGMASVTNEVHESRPWYGEMWESVKTANEGLPETVPDGG